MWERTPRGALAREIVAVEMQCADRDAVAGRWAALLGRDVRTEADGTAQIALDRGVLRFAHAADGADGVTVIDVAVADRARTLAAAAARGCVRGHAIFIGGASIRVV